MPPPISGSNICIRPYMVFSLVSSKIFLLATLDQLHSIKFMFLKLEIWACSMTSKSNYIFLSSLIASFQSALKHTQNLHKIAHKMSKNCLSRGASDPAVMTENWIRCTHPECVVDRRSDLNSLGVFTAFPRSHVVEGAALRQEGGNRRGTEGRKPTNGKS